jgi:hypothetical protein
MPFLFKETRSHQITWKNRGELIKGQQKLVVDFWMEIEQILGTADSDDLLSRE